MEIEEEEEIKKLNELKSQFFQRKDNEKEKWRITLKKEEEKVRIKDSVLEKYQEKDNLKTDTLKKVQSFNIGKGYLSLLQSNTIKNLFKNGIYQNSFDNLIKTEYFDWLLNNTCEEVNKMKNFKENCREIIKGFNLYENFMKIRNPFDDKIKKKVAKRDLRRYNYENKENKVFRLFFKNKNQTIPSNFAKNFSKFVDGSLVEHEKNMEERLLALKSEQNI